ncbi:MAG: VOC family protein [Pirellulaceae bacterium]
MKFRVHQIDHVELTVPDRHTAAQWYQHVLGLQAVADFEHWANDPDGPLMISTEGGGTKLALFSGDPVGSQRGTGFHLVAFRVGATQFMNFLDQLPELQLRDRHDQVLTRHSVKDHGLAFSIYFCDPWKHQLELTTYEYDETVSALKKR